MLLTAALALCATASAGPDATRDSMDRLEEVLELRIDDGLLSAEEVLPAVLVSARPRYAESEDWFTTRAVEVLQRAFGGSGIRLCEACAAPRAYVQEGRLVYQTGPVGLDEVARLDDQYRGSAAPARTAIWLDEHRGGVSIRIVELATGRVLHAQNVDPLMIENRNTRRAYTLAAELERRARGDSLTQGFVDLAVYPGQHLSIDWTDQWGPANASLSGVTLAAFDPVLGVGACHYQRVPVLNSLVGGKVILSLPTALVRVIGDQDVDLLDPIVTGVGVVRVPFGRTNYGAILAVSTNGQIGVGLSLMNISLLPVIP